MIADHLNTTGEFVDRDITNEVEPVHFVALNLQ